MGTFPELISIVRTDLIFCFLFLVTYQLLKLSIRVNLDTVRSPAPEKSQVREDPQEGIQGLWVDLRALGLQVSTLVAELPFWGSFHGTWFIDPLRAFGLISHPRISFS